MNKQAIEYLLSENTVRRKLMEGDIQDLRNDIQHMEEELSALEVEWHELNDKVKNNRSTFTKED